MHGAWAHPVEGGKREAHILGKKMHLLVCDQNADLFVEHP